MVKFFDRLIFIVSVIMIITLVYGLIYNREEIKEQANILICGKINCWISLEVKLGVANA